MIQKISAVPYYTNYTPSFSGKKALAEKEEVKSNTSKDLLIASLFALSSMGILGCQFNNPEISPINRRAVYDPCCGTTSTQFKDINLSQPIEKFDLMLNNLGIIDKDEISWQDIDSIKIQADDGSEFLLENRGVRFNGGYLDFAITKKTQDGRKDSVICHLNNDYGGINIAVEATNNDLIGEIPIGSAHIWQGNKGEHDDRFVIVNTAPEGLWDNVIQIEKITGNKIEVQEKDGDILNLFLDSVEIYEK